ncbi:MFS general substrate transporter [Mycena floridula]|nr:MFS general substrate transporter [Mycena floridula]
MSSTEEPILETPKVEVEQPQLAAVAPKSIFSEEALDPIYRAKATILNDAMQEIGMGKYQWGLFVVTGFGWFADNLWPLVTSLIQTPVMNEFNRFNVEYLRLAQNIGLLVGAGFWGIGAVSFNITLAVTGVFAIAAIGSHNMVTLCALAAVWSFGVGGNLPVDSAIFIEFVPPTQEYHLANLSVWWAFGELIGSLVSWPLIQQFSCPSAEDCSASTNQGWRYFLFAMGGLMLLLWGIRFFAFKLYESPKYLMGYGRDEQAVKVMHKVAEFNGKTSSLTVEQLKAPGPFMQGDGRRFLEGSLRKGLLRKINNFSTKHVLALFATRNLAFSTSLLILIWALIGLAFPLYQSFVTFYLASRGATFTDGSIPITYRNQVILSATGIPGAFLAAYLIQRPILGRRRTLALATIITGVLIMASTTARSSNALLGWNCAYSFTSNVMYSALYAMTPEMFPTKDRGTGNAIAACAGHLFGVIASIIALYADLTKTAPIWIAGAMFLLAGFLCLLLPFEPRGKAAL